MKRFKISEIFGLFDMEVFGRDVLKTLTSFKASHLLVVSTLFFESVENDWEVRTPKS